MQESLFRLQPTKARHAAIHTSSKPEAEGHKGADDDQPDVLVESGSHGDEPPGRRAVQQLVQILVY